MRRWEGGQDWWARDGGMKGGGIAGNTLESGTYQVPGNRIAGGAWPLAQVGRGGPGKTK